MSKVLIYDSGVGGRSVYQLLFSKLKDQIDAGTLQLDYFGDTDHFPYGTKSEAELKIIVEKNLEKFSQEHYDLIGVACNTASLIIDQMGRDAKLRVSTIIEPTLTKIKDLQPTSLFIIGTQFTIDQKIYSKLIKSFNPDAEIIEQEEQELVRLVEEKKFLEIQEHIHRIISQIDSSQTLLLGCTHFSVVKELFVWEIEKQGRTIQMIDPAEELAEKIIKILENN